MDLPLGPEEGTDLQNFKIRICVTLSHQFGVNSYSSDGKIMQYVYSYSLKLNAIRLCDHKNRPQGDFHKLKDIYISYIYELSKFSLYREHPRCLFSVTLRVILYFFSLVQKYSDTSHAWLVL